MAEKQKAPSLDDLDASDLETLKQVNAGKATLDQLSVSGLETLKSINNSTQNSENGLANLVAPHNKFANKAIQAAVSLGNIYDSVAGAPVRKAIGDFQNYQPGTSLLNSYVSQLGKDPSLAPTGKEIAQKAGFSSVPLSERLPNLFSEADQPGYFKKGGLADVSPAGVAGLAVDVVADPTMVLPAKALATVGLKAGEGGVKAGFAAGKTLAKGGATIADVLTGTKAATRSLGELGKTIETSVDAGKNAVKALTKTLKPTVAEDFGKYLDIAKRNNIDPAILPDAVEFGDKSLISRLSRTQAEGPVGEALLKKHEAFRGALGNAMERQVETIGGGPALDAASAGNTLREAFDTGLKDAFNQYDFTHSTIINQVPNLQVSEKALGNIESKLNGIEKFAKGRVMRGITQTQRTQGEQLLKAVEAARNSNGSYKQMYEAMKDIGDVAFNPKFNAADIPPDVQKLRDLYFTINDSLIDTAKTNVGPEIAQQLVENNKGISKLLREKDAVFHVLGNPNLADEKVFSQMILNGDTRQLAAIKNIISPESWDRLRASYLDNFIKSSAGDALDIKQVKSLLEKAPARLGVLFSPDELKSIAELVDLADRGGISIMSTSGTGASQGLRGITNTLVNAVTDDTVLQRMRDFARKRPIPSGSGSPSGVVLLNGPLSESALQSFVTKLGPSGRTRPENISKINQILSVQDQNIRRR